MDRAAKGFPSADALSPVSSGRLGAGHKMSSEKRFFLAVAISFLILLFYPVYLRWVSPPSVSGPAQGENRSVPDSNPDLARIEAEKLSSAPPVSKPPEETARSANTYQFSHRYFTVEFSDRGGSVMKLLVKEWKKDKKGEAVFVDAASDDGAFLTNLPGRGIDFGNEIFALEVLDERAGEVRFSSEKAGEWKLTKTFLFSAEQPVIHLRVSLENRSPLAQTAALEVTSQLRTDDMASQDHYFSQSFTALPDKLTAVRLDKVAKKPQVLEGKITWQALTRKYFALIIQPDQPAAFSQTFSNHKNTRVFRNTLRSAPAVIAAGENARHEFLIYAGPQYYKDLKSFGTGFDRILSHGFFGVFKLWLLVALEWTHKAVGNYGWAIILITVAIKLLFTPLTHMSFESMKKMQALQPKIKALQERYKNDQAKLSQEMMELYKKQKVNPLSGCLPMVLQIPIFIAFYNVLAQTVELQGEPFIGWIRDLSQPDRLWALPFALPFLGDGVNVLPLLMLGSMVWQQRLTPQTGTPDQQKIMMIMPIVFGFIFYNLPSGLVLYWFVNNMLSIFHQLFVKGKALPHHEE